MTGEQQPFPASVAAVAVAGWYPDPWDAASLRFWDGTSWSPATARPEDHVGGDRMLAAFGHMGFVLAPIVLPLVLRFTGRGRVSPFVADHCARAANFQITFLGVWLSVMAVYAGMATTDAAGAALLTWWLAAMVLLGAGGVVSVWAAVRASQGREWRYWVALPFVDGSTGNVEAAR